MSPLLHTYKAAAARLGLSELALRTLAKRGRGPAMVRIGRRVMFRDIDLIAWVDGHAEAARPAAPPPSLDVSEYARPKGRRKRSIAEQMGFAAGRAA